MSLRLVLALSLVIWLPGLLSAVRYSKIRKVFYPFIYLVWVGCINETLSAWLILSKFETVINNNFYILLEPVMLLWFFKELGTFRQRQWLFPAAVILVISWWGTELAFQGSLQGNLYYYRFFYASGIIFLGIIRLNNLLLKPTLTQQDKATLLISAIFIFYFSFKILVDAFWLYGLEADREFLVGLAYIFVFVNLISNLCFALAVAWMPRKKGY